MFENWVPDGPAAQSPLVKRKFVKRRGAIGDVDQPLAGHEETINEVRQKVVGSPPSSRNVEGVNFPIDCSLESIRDAFSYEPEDDEVVIVSLPRSGAVCVAAVVHQLRNNLRPMRDFERSCPLLERDGQAAKLSRNFTAFRTYMPLRKLQINPLSKYIYVIRNPKDYCAVLYQYNMSNPIFEFKHGTIDGFFEYWADGKVCYNNYFEHVVAFWKHRRDACILFLTYESFVLDLKSTILMIANFLGPKERAAAMVRKQLNEIVTHSNYQEVTKMIVDEKHGEFLGKVRVGEYKSVLTEAIRDEIDQMFWMNFATKKGGLDRLWNHIIHFKDTIDNELTTLGLNLTNHHEH